MTGLRDASLFALVLPHGFCYQWDPLLVWLHAISDTLIALAYFSIPLPLIWFVTRRRDLSFGWMFLCFALFIAACGTTHLIDVLTIWVPKYWLSAAVRVFTAFASLPTAVFLVQLLPRALLIPSTEEMKAVNEELRKQDKALRESEERFRQMADNIQEIFWMVDPRTKEIMYANEAFELICERPLTSLYANPTSYGDLIHPVAFPPPNSCNQVLLCLNNGFGRSFREKMPSLG